MDFFSIDINKINESSNKYLLELFNLENILLNKEPNNNIEEIDITILNTNLDSYFTKETGKFMKSFQNSIYLIKISMNQNFFNIPKPEFIKNTSFENIIDFYEIIYMKMLNTNSNSNSYTLKKSNNILKEISSFNIQSNIIKIKDDSCDYLTSKISLSNWFEEYENLNIFGLLILFTLPKYSNIGIYEFDLFDYPNMNINSIANNFSSVLDYYELILMDNNFKDNFHINNFKISDNTAGNTNIILPLYINKNHWKYAKLIWTYHMSFINGGFEFDYNKKMDNVYLYVLLKYFLQIKNNILNVSSIRLYIYLLRTCIQICIDNKYISSVKSEYVKYKNILLNTSNDKLNKFLNDFLLRFMQYSIMTCDSQTEHDAIINDIKEIKCSFVKKYVDFYYKIDFWEHYSKLDEQQKILEIEEIKNNLKKTFSNVFTLFRDLLDFHFIVNSIFKIKGFNQFIKIIDKYNGCLTTNVFETDINYTVISQIFNNVFEKSKLEINDIVYVENMYNFAIS